MARTNTRPINPHGKTHEGAPAAPMNAEQALRRSIMSCLLWEREFYEDGEEIAARIVRLAGSVPAAKVAAIAIEAREQGNLRHVPLLLLSALSRTGRGSNIVADTIARVVQRADELAELLAIHAKANNVEPNAVKKTISAQMKKGLARAFLKFDEYQLAKYDRDGAVRLRDALFLVHAKPRDADQAALWKRLVAGQLAVPDTWETQLSGGADKRETFERLMREGNLGYLALLRNLRNMQEARCDGELIRDAITARKNGAHRVLPFRYIAAARAAPQFEPALDKALQAAIAEMSPLHGTTFVLVDVSGSMDTPLSAKSDLKRMDAAAALGSIVNADSLRVFSFSNQIVEVAPRRGMSGVDAIVRSQAHGSTYLGTAVRRLADLPHDRLIVITDEQSHDVVPEPVAKHAYIINVASAQRGVGYGRWTRINGFSESVLKFIHAHETASR